MLGEHKSHSRASVDRWDAYRLLASVLITFAFVGFVQRRRACRSVFKHEHTWRKGMNWPTESVLFYAACKTSGTEMAHWLWTRDDAQQRIMNIMRMNPVSGVGQPKKTKRTQNNDDYIVSGNVLRRIHWGKHFWIVLDGFRTWSLGDRDEWMDGLCTLRRGKIRSVVFKCRVDDGAKNLWTD